MNWSVQYRSCFIDVSTNNSNLHVLKRTSTANSSIWSLAGQSVQPCTRAANSGIPMPGQLVARDTTYSGMSRGLGRTVERIRAFALHAGAAAFRRVCIRCVGPQGAKPPNNIKYLLLECRCSRSSTRVQTVQQCCITLPDRQPYPGPTAQGQHCGDRRPAGPAVDVAHLHRRAGRLPRHGAQTLKLLSHRPVSSRSAITLHKAHRATVCG
jgi:hypothetical protein